MVFKNKHYAAKALVSTIAIFSLGLLLLLTENGYFNAIFQKIGVYPEPEKYTALFFMDTESLLHEGGAVNKIESFTFGIHNNGGKDQDYAFSVELQTKSKKIQIERGYVWVKSGETRYRKIAFNAKEYLNPGVVYVTLPLQNKSIDFRIN